MTDLVSDDVMHVIVLDGTPDVVEREIMRRYGDCDRISVYFPGYEPADDLIADFVSAMRDASATDG